MIYWPTSWFLLNPNYARNCTWAHSGCSINDWKARNEWSYAIFSVEQIKIRWHIKWPKHASEHKTNIHFSWLYFLKWGGMQIMVGTNVRYSHHISCIMSNSKISIKLQNFVWGTELRNQEGYYFENGHFCFPKNTVQFNMKWWYYHKLWHHIVWGFI